MRQLGQVSTKIEKKKKLSKIIWLVRLNFPNICTASAFLSSGINRVLERIPPALIKKWNNSQAVISVERAQCAYKEPIVAHAMQRNGDSPHIHRPLCYSASIPTIPKNRSGKTADVFFFFLLLVVSSESQRKCNMNLFSTALISFHLSNVASDKSTNTNEECDSTDHVGTFLQLQVWPQLVFGLGTSACVAAQLKWALCWGGNCAAGKTTLIEL